MKPLMAVEGEDLSTALKLGPFYLLVVIIHVWLLYLFANALALVMGGLPGVRSLWQMEVAPDFSVFSCFVIASAALTLISLLDLRGTFRAAKSRKYWLIVWSVNCIFLMGIWVNIYTLWSGPLNDTVYAQRVLDEPTRSGRYYDGHVLQGDAAECLGDQEPCISVELFTGEQVAASLRDGLVAAPADRVYLIETIGTFSERSWYEVYDVESVDQ